MSQACVANTWPAPFAILPSHTLQCTGVGTCGAVMYIHIVHPCFVGWCFVFMAAALFHGATSVERVSVSVPVTLRFHRHTLVLPGTCLAYEISSCFFRSSLCLINL